MRKFSTYLLITALLISGCSKPAETSQETGILRGNQQKIVEVFTPNESQIEVKLSKSGIIKAQNEVTVSPQIAGKIVKINQKIGSKVKKDSPLVVLGDSLSTDLIDIAADSAEKSLNLSKNSKDLATHSGQQSLIAAELAVDTAYLSYQNALISKQNSEDNFDLQLENAEIEVKNAKIGYYNAEDAYDRTDDNLDDALDSDVDLLIDAAESALDQAKSAAKIAKNRYKQAEIALEQLESSQISQLDQLNFAINTAYNQYKAAQQQLDVIAAQIATQQNQAEAQIIQSETGLKNSQANQKQKTIKSPINGIITEINVQENNLTSPGQPIIKIANLDSLIAETFINTDEASLIKVGDKVEIETSTQKASGKIAAISPYPDTVTKKLKVEIKLTKVPETLENEAFARINFLPNLDTNIFIPLNSVFLEDNKKYVKIAKDQKVEKQEIQTGEIIGEHIEVTSGLTGDEKIITTVDIFLDEGEKIKIAQ